MPGTTARTVRGGLYAYFEYFEGGRTVQGYCGPAGSAKSGSAALKYEYDLMKAKRSGLPDMVREIRGG